MKDQKSNLLPSLKEPGVIFLSWFGTGFSKYAPGTMGSIATLPLLMLLSFIPHPEFFLIVPLILMTVGSSILADIYQKKLKSKDPQWIVIDEVIGMIITWLFYPSGHPLFLLCALGLFRIFDIIKIWPASFFDQKVKHGSGVILDDVVSGIYAGVLYLLISHYLLIKFI